MYSTYINNDYHSLIDSTIPIQRTSYDEFLIDIKGQDAEDIICEQRGEVRKKPIFSKSHLKKDFLRRFVIASVFSQDLASEMEMEWAHQEEAFLKLIKPEKIDQITELARKVKQLNCMQPYLDKPLQRIQQSISNGKFKAYCDYLAGDYSWSFNFAWPRRPNFNEFMSGRNEELCRLNSAMNLELLQQLKGVQTHKSHVIVCTLDSDPEAMVFLFETFVLKQKKYCEAS